MYKMRFIWKKIIAIVSSFIGLNFLTACRNAFVCMYGAPEDTPEDVLCMYGMPEDYGNISGTVSGDIDGDGKPEPLANVKIYEKNPPHSVDEPAKDEEYVTKTGEDGQYFIRRYEKGEYSFRFEDGDGSENGFFKSKEETIKYEGTDMTHDVTMEKQQ